VKRILVLLTVAALAVGGCASHGGGGEPATSPSVSAAASPSPSVSVDAIGCGMARALDASSAVGDFATVGSVLSSAQDGALADAGVRLKEEAMVLSASRTEVYRAYLDVLSECLRVSP
jgi:hypothetical protein